jgi:hypothetical protein
VAEDASYTPNNVNRGNSFLVFDSQVRFQFERHDRQIMKRQSFTTQVIPFSCDMTSSPKQQELGFGDLLLRLLGLCDGLLEDLEDLLVGDLLVGLVLGHVKGWRGSKLLHTVLGDG